MAQDEMLAVLIVAVFGCLILGLIVPRLFKFLFKGEIPSRKKILLVFGGTTFALFFLFAFITKDTAPQTQKPTLQQQAIQTKQDPVVATLLPGIKEFITQNSQYGTVKETASQPDWANGKRQEVATTTGRYLFSTHNNEVVGVWKYESNGERKQLFQKDIPQMPQNVEVNATADLPQYTILFQVNMVGGKGKMADILIPSYSLGTSKEIRETTARKIAQKEGFTDLTLYSTQEAKKANESASYSKQNPGALKNGYLGSLREGKFTP